MFQKRYEQTASPFQWTFTRNYLPLCWQNSDPKRLPLPPNKYATVIPVQSTKLAFEPGSHLIGSRSAPQSFPLRNCYDCHRAKKRGASRLPFDQASEIFLLLRLLAFFRRCRGTRAGAGRHCAVDPAEEQSVVP